MRRLVSAYRTEKSMANQLLIRFAIGCQSIVNYVMDNAKYCYPPSKGKKKNIFITGFISKLYKVQEEPKLLYFSPLPGADRAYYKVA
jgi:hypothetical protein